MSAMLGIVNKILAKSKYLLQTNPKAGPRLHCRIPFPWQETPMLDPQARALIDLMTERGVPPTHTLAPAEARRLYRERRAYVQPAAITMAEVRDLSASGPQGPIGLRLYRPTTAPSPAPALVYYHGGGWVIGDLDTHDVLCRELAHRAGCVVLAV